MEVLLGIAALFFIGIPVLLFFLVIGARDRTAKLDRQVANLRDEVNRLRAQIAAQSLPSSAVEPAPVPPVAGPAAVAAPAVAPPPARAALPSPKPVSAEPISLRPEPVPAAAIGAAARTIPAAATSLLPHVPPAPPAWFLKAKEWLLGGNLVAKAGLLILFFGVSFLIKFAAARVSVPIELRLAGIALADLGLLLWGWRIRDKRPGISLPVQGAALGILMLVTFGAFRMYELIPGGLAFGLLFFLTFFTCLLAVLQNAVWLSVFGIAGGFAAPILTSTGQGNYIGLFSYYALLNAGILAIALKRSWRLLNLLGFAFTFLIATAWGVLRYQPENYGSVQCFLALFLVFYVAIAVLYASKQAPRLKDYVDSTLVFGTPLVAFGLQYGLVRDKPFGLAFSALALGLFYLGLTLALWQRRGSSLRLLVESFLAIGIVFGTLAIPFALDGRWTSAAWALEGAGIVWVGLRQKRPLAWAFGVLIQVGAWITFLGSASGLSSVVAARSNLWLGFLLLAGSGLAMAMSFRQKARQDGHGTPKIVLLLANLFLGSASLWLLAGAWTEIFLHTSGNQQGTWLVLSGVVVAALLGLIAGRLAWGVARYFALAPQLAAGVMLALLARQFLDWPLQRSQGNLFDSPFLGALLIALSAAISSLVFSRQPDGTHRSISRYLLGWSGLWWFALVLPSLADWGRWMLLAHTTLAVSGEVLFQALYQLLLALGGIAFARLATRLPWPDLRWSAAAVWLGLLLAMVGILGTLMGPGEHIPPAITWLGATALWLASEWLLRDGNRNAWLTPEGRPGTLRALHTLRTVGPWLILWPLGHHLVARLLQVPSAQEAALLADAGWFTAGSWARLLPTWAMMAVIGLLIPRVRSQAWPVAPVADWYRKVLIPLGALWSLGLVLLWNFTQNGRMEPLPYLPLLNPLDLTTGFAALLGIAAWRLYAKAASASLPSQGAWCAALLAYTWFNLMLLRTAAHFLDIPCQVDPLFHSQFVQAMLSLVWNATALVVMRFAASRRRRGPWMAGAGLLALVVAKLFFVDLSNVGGIGRVISFLGVGLLMLAISYLAPFPSDKTAKEESA